MVALHWHLYTLDLVKRTETNMNSKVSYDTKHQAVSFSVTLYNRVVHH